MAATKKHNDDVVHDEFYEVETSKNHKVVLDDIQVPVQSNVAAGIPVLELVKRYEEENIISRQDRLTFYESFKDPLRREILIQALADVEVGTNPRFSVQRLKAHIHQNPGGLPNGKTPLPQALHARRNNQNPSILRPELDLPSANNIMNLPKLENIDANLRNNNNGVAAGILSQVSPLSTVQLNKMVPIKSMAQNHSIEKIEPPVKVRSPSKESSTKSISSVRTKRTSPGSKISKNALSTDDSTFCSAVKSDIKEAISDIVGEVPAYKHTYNVCQKMEERLAEHLMRQGRKRSRNRLRLGVIIGSGSCNPLTRMHMRRFYLAKQHLESRSDMFILGSLVSPVHHTVVRERYRNYLLISHTD